VTILSVIPAIIWIFMLSLSVRFADAGSVFTSLGQVTGLVGMAMFSISLILSARVRFWNEWFNGLNRIYINHHRIGAIAFILLLFHPIFLTYNYLTFSLRSAADFWLPSSNWALTFGKIGLFGMIVLLILTFFVSLKYNTWKNTHKYMGLAFFFGGLHSLFITSDISGNIILREYMLTLAGLGILFYIYHTILGRFLTKQFDYIVDEVKKLNGSIVEITLSPFRLNKEMRYSAGQFAFISFADGKIGTEQHPFSFVSSPKENTIKFAIKNLGDYTAGLPTLSKGTLAKIDGPFGVFSYKNIPNKKQIWIAGGIGITPFVSMAVDLSLSKYARDYSIDLYYCVRNQEELVLQDVLTSVANQCPRFRLIPFLSDTDGRINAKFIGSRSDGFLDKDIMLCGPLPLVTSLKEQFAEFGVKKGSMHSEEFSL